MAKGNFTGPSSPTNNIQSQPDQPIISATALKLLFDQYGIDTNNYLSNSLISELNSSASGNTGANKIGINVAGITADNVEEAIEEVSEEQRTLLKGETLVTLQTASLNFQDGDIVKTSGFWTEKDNGYGTYIVKNVTGSEVWTTLLGTVKVSADFELHIDSNYKLVSLNTDLCLNEIGLAETTTADQQTINTNLNNFLFNNLTANNNIDIRKGTYNFYTGLIINTVNNININCNWSKFIKQGANIPVFRFLNCEFGSIINAEIDGNKSGGKLGPGISLLGASKIKIQDNRVYNNKSQGIGIDGQTFTCIDNEVTNNYVFDNDGVGISQNTSNNNLIEANYVVNNGLEGITLDVDTFFTVVTDNRLVNNCVIGGVGQIGVDKGLHCQIINNRIAGNSLFPGIRLQNNVGNSNGNIIANNRISEATIGVKLANNGGNICNENVINSNIFLNVTGNEVEIDLSCTDNIVTSNSAIGAFNILDNGTNTIIANNV